MTTVFVVERGDYSDRSTYGIFSTEEKALAWIRSQPKCHRYDDGFDVTEWDLDPSIDVEFKRHQHSTFLVTYNDFVGEVHGVVQIDPRDSIKTRPGVAVVYAATAEDAVRSALFDWRVKRANADRACSGED